MGDKFACPKCGNEEYQVDDYSEDFDIDGGAQWWILNCPVCHCKYEVTLSYKLTDILVKVSES